MSELDVCPRCGTSASRCEIWVRGMVTWGLHRERIEAVSERPTILRAAPEPRLKEIPDDEAIDLSKTAFYAARRSQLELMACHLNTMLFDPCAVNYRRLKGLRTEARKQVELALRTEQLIQDAIEAFDATRPLP